MKIFTAEQIREIDAATIRLEPIASVDLMERAATAAFYKIKDITSSDKRILIFSGPGNNGGDGLAIARMLLGEGYSVEPFTVETGAAHSADMDVNYRRLLNAGMTINSIRDVEDIPVIYPEDVVIDAILGSGLSRPPRGIVAEVIRKINSSGAFIASVDIPSGLYCDDNSDADMSAIIKADLTLTFQFPKLAFMFAGSDHFTGKWEILDIGLHSVTISLTESVYSYTEACDIEPMIRRRGKFDHKGSFGHALIIAGSYGKTGAAILASQAALRAGAGLVTVHAPASSVVPLQVAVPEAMVSPDPGTEYVTTIPDLAKYTAVGVGPGLGTDPDTRKMLADLVNSWSGPMVIDADALNILALQHDIVDILPENTIITPHHGEFSRLIGSKLTGYRLLDSQRKYASQHKCIVVLKGACTSVALPDGRTFFNSTGNAGMATAGSGDVLTGMIVSLLARGYSPHQASVAGVFLHGLAGDIALEKESEESLIAGDIIMNIGQAYIKTIHQTV